MRLQRGRKIAARSTLHMIDLGQIGGGSGAIICQKVKDHKEMIKGERQKSLHVPLVIETNGQGK